MQTIVLVMQRISVAQGLSAALQKEQAIELHIENDYTRAGAVTRAYQANSVLVEVTESGDYDTPYCLHLCDSIKKALPNCKLLLMCPERDKNGIQQAVSAKQTGRIDNFVFYDASLKYLSSMLLSV